LTSGNILSRSYHAGIAHLFGIDGDAPRQAWRGPDNAASLRRCREERDTCGVVGAEGLTGRKT